MQKLIADTHTHSIASDHAYSTILENIKAAQEQGLSYLAMTEHGPAMPDAPHSWHIQCQWDIPSVCCGVNILHGVEANIMDSEGGLDVSDSILAGLEWVIASMHGRLFPHTTREEHTKAWLRIAANPLVDVIGHCAKGDYEFDEQRVLTAFREYGKLVEVNNSCFLPGSSCIPRYMEILRLCKKLEVPVVVNTDSHFAGNIGVFTSALTALEEIDFPESLIVNADLERFEQVVAQKRAGLLH